MQRTYSVPFSGLLLITLVLPVHASSYEHDGKIYNFRQQESAVEQQASSTGVNRPSLDQQNQDNEMMKQLEAKGYVFRPMRKRKTLDDPAPVNNPRQQQNPAYRFESCPTPQPAQRMPQVTPVNPAMQVPPPPAYPSVPAMPGTMPSPLGYPYTMPSPYSFPYPSGGAMPMPGMPFPGGFGYPGW
jgi:hypothetical protein